MTLIQLIDADKPKLLQRKRGRAATKRKTNFLPLICADER
jgi:hypothetical protein